ncbi:hypothetical protein BG015_008183, partial [Linnemannia schmuckeri]
MSSAPSTVQTAPAEPALVQLAPAQPPLFASIRALAIPEILHNTGLFVQTYKLWWNPNNRRMEPVTTVEISAHAHPLDNNGLFIHKQNPLDCAIIDIGADGVKYQKSIIPQQPIRVYREQPTLKLALTNSRIRLLELSNCSLPLEVLVQDCPDTLLSLTISGARSGIGPLTRGLLIASTSLVELGLDSIWMPVSGLITILTYKRSLRTINIGARCVFEQGPL